MCGRGAKRRALFADLEFAYAVRHVDAPRPVVSPAGTWGALPEFGNVVPISHLHEASGQLGSIALMAGAVDSATRREPVDTSGTEEALAM
jgi:hypothetical protein